jgi:hypothetical protein
MGVSVRAYARHRGIADNAVRKAIKAGRIAPEADGSIDVAKADLAWEANTDHTKRHAPAGLKDVNAEDAIESVKQTLAENGRPTGGMNSFTQARTAHEIAKAHLARQRLQEKKGQLVNKDMVKAQVFRLGRQFRDSWINWPSRISAQMASEMQVDEHVLHMTLERYVREHLNELGDAKLDIE